MDTLWKIRRSFQGKKRELHIAVKNEKGNKFMIKSKLKLRNQAAPTPKSSSA